MREMRPATRATTTGVVWNGIVEIIGDAMELVATVTTYSWMTTSGAVMRKVCMNLSRAASRVRKGRLFVLPITVW